MPKTQQTTKHCAHNSTTNENNFQFSLVSAKIYRKCMRTDDDVDVVATTKKTGKSEFVCVCVCVCRFIFRLSCLRSILSSSVSLPLRNSLHLRHKHIPFHCVLLLASNNRPSAVATERTEKISQRAHFAWVENEWEKGATHCQCVCECVHTLYRPNYECICVELIFVSLTNDRLFLYLKCKHEPNECSCSSDARKEVKKKHKTNEEKTERIDVEAFYHRTTFSWIKKRKIIFSLALTFVVDRRTTESHSNRFERKSIFSLFFLLVAARTFFRIVWSSAACCSVLSPVFSQNPDRTKWSDVNKSDFSTKNCGFLKLKLKWWIG